MRNSKIFITIIAMSSIIFLASIPIIISLANYAAYFQPWYSFLTLKEAIIYLILFSVLALISLSSLIFSIYKLIKNKKSE